MKHACDRMNFDVEATVVKIYSHFYLYTVRVTQLKKICNEAGEQYHQLLGYAKTRFFALHSAIGSILQVFEALKSYFLQLNKPPK